jgi:hypothetical protein
MRRKLILLILALMSVAGALATSVAPAAEAECNRVCCPNLGCFCCAKPCYFFCH